LAQSVLDDLEDRTSIELVEDYSHKLTLMVICGMLGVPEKDTTKVVAWLSEIEALVHSALGTEERKAAAERSFAESIPFFREIVSQRRSCPTDDLISTMVRSSQGRDVLTTHEVVATSILLLFAGQTTTTSLVAMTLLALLQNPDQLALLRA